MHWDANLIRLSPPARYALQGMVYLARHPHKLLLVKEIALATGLPPDFLAKIFQRLAAGGLLKSRRGKGGGYYLDKDPESISASDIVACADGLNSPMAVRQCFLYEKPCSAVKSCYVHNVVDRACGTISSMLSTMTLAQLASENYFSSSS